MTLDIPRWQRRDDLACASSDPDLFDTDTLKGETEWSRRARVEKAIRICHTCPVINECKAQAVADHTLGVVRGGSAFDGKRKRPAIPETLDARRAARAERLSRSRCTPNSFDAQLASELRIVQRNVARIR